MTRRPTQPRPLQLKTRRLNLALSSAGLTSRRQADEWIKSGRVIVNGTIVKEPGFRVILGRDRICVDGKEIPAPPHRLYLMLNKPFGYISSLRDPEGRPVVTDLMTEIPQRVFSVGRLDFDSMGLLLFTNDGEWAYRLTHPSYRVPRTYKATVRGRITDQALEELRRGVRLSDGPSGRATVTLIDRDQRQSQVRATITQGRPRQVRRMFEAVGYEVIHLTRIGFGTILLGDLKVGHYRHLQPEEVYEMKKMVGMAGD
ncbi:MAG: pseudouridine synthase [Pseudomonadota bacterium]